MSRSLPRHRAHDPGLVREKENGRFRSVRLPRLIAAFVLRRLWRRALRLTAGEIGTVRAEATTTSVPATTPMHPKTILTAVALLVAVLVLAGVRLRLAATTGDECGKAA